ARPSRSPGGQPDRRGTGEMRSGPVWAAGAVRGHPRPPAHGGQVRHQVRVTGLWRGTEIGPDENVMLVEIVRHLGEGLSDEHAIAVRTRHNDAVSAGSASLGMGCLITREPAAR